MTKKVVEIAALEILKRKETQMPTDHKDIWFRKQQIYC